MTVAVVNDTNSTGGQACGTPPRRGGQRVDNRGVLHRAQVTLLQDVGTVGVPKVSETRIYAGESPLYPQSTGLITVITDISIPCNSNNGNPAVISHTRTTR